MDVYYVYIYTTEFQKLTHNNKRFHKLDLLPLNRECGFL